MPNSLGSIVTARALVHAWLSWWVEIMLGWLPEKPLARTGIVSPSVWLSPSAEGLSVSWQAVPGRSLQELGSVRQNQDPRMVLGPRKRTAGVRWILAVPSSQAIVKEVRLPSAVRPRLDEVLRFELDRYTPFSADSALFGYSEIPSSTTATINVRLATVPRAWLQDQLDRLAAVRVVPERIVVRLSNDTAHAVPILNYSPGTSTLRRASVAALSVAALLIATLLLVPLMEKRSMVLDWEQHHATLLPEAQVVAALEGERDALLKRLQRPFREKHSRHPILDVLLGLSETIPDHSHLLSLRIEGDELRLDGETRAATELIEPLNALPQLREVRFLSPTGRISDQRERFQIGANITSRGDFTQ